MLAAILAVLMLPPFLAAGAAAADDAEVAAYRRAVEQRFAEWLEGPLA